MKKENPIWDLIVIGGGPSGMMMAGTAGNNGKKVLLIEKNVELGKKLSWTGGGRCNITNAEFGIRKFLDNFPQSKEFLYSPFSKFSSKDTFNFFEKRGLPLVIEARKRAFPKSQKASDVVKTMFRFVKQSGTHIKLSSPVIKIKKQSNGYFLIQTINNKFLCKKLAIATGGLASPESGSTGDGFKFLKRLGHTISKPNPNIVPLTTKEKWVHRLSGLSLSFMRISFTQEGKVKVRKTGKILFTHFGISGPLILNSAFEVKKLLEKGSVYASVDCFPDTNEKELNNRLLRIFDKHKNKKLKNVLPEILPEVLSKEILEMDDIKLSDEFVNNLTKEQRKSLVKKIKNLRFEISGTLGFDKAVIADGGVIPEEIDFKNFTSKIHKNLYILGDVISINRPSGGFSLQMCWTCGYVAGNSI